MLARRAAQRSFSQLIRKDALALQRRGLGPSLRPTLVPGSPPLAALPPKGGARSLTQLSQFQVRPPGWKGKLWFKADGTPRSKLKGIIVATLLGAAGFTLWSALSVISDLDAANYILLCLIHIQQMDADYHSVDFDDYKSLHTYFFTLCSALFGDVPQEIIDSFCDDVYFLPSPTKEHAHRIMVDASRDVHEVIRAGKGVDGWETAVRVVKRLEAALMDLGELMDDTDNTDEFVRLRTAKLKDISAVGERGGKAEDSYDIVG